MSLTDDALTAYLTIVGGHPQRAMLVADCAWSLVDDGATIDRPELDAAVDDAIARCADEFAATTTLLTDAQSRVARLVAWSEPFTGAAAGRLGVSQGSSRAAAATLVDRGLLRRDGSRHEHVDPLFAEWLRRLGPEALSLPEPELAVADGG